MKDITLLQFVLLGLATYRVTRLITRDMVTAPLRNAFWKKFPPESSYLGYLSTCEWCFSFWIGSGFVISAIIIPSVTYIVATVYAVSAIAGLLTAYEDK
jgi:hypothetical protein